jgi:hypothetical protein
MQDGDIDLSGRRRDGDLVLRIAADQALPPYHLFRLVGIFRTCSQLTQ